MRITILSLITLVLAAAFFAQLPADLELWRNAALVALGLWLAVEGWRVRSMSESRRLLEEKAAKAEGDAAHLRTELAEEKQQTAAAAAHLRATLTTAEAQVASLRAALSATETQSAAAAASLKEAQAAVKSAKAATNAAGDGEVLSFLGLLQQKGRFLDFLMDDITKYPDAQVGAAARVVHQGCSAVTREYFAIKPVHDGQEGGPLTLAKDYDASRYRLLGRVTGEPPFRGRVLHRGWLTDTVKLPERLNGGATGIITPAEIELS